MKHLRILILLAATLAQGSAQTKTVGPNGEGITSGTRSAFLDALGGTTAGKNIFTGTLDPLARANHTGTQPASTILDASASGKTVLTGTPAQGRAALETETSTTGGANKVVQIRSDGKIHLPDVLLPNPLPTLSRSGSSFLTFKRSDITVNGGKADFGQLGSAEANMSWNMDFTLGAGNHRYWDSTIGATWASCSSQATWNSFSIQYAPPGLSGGSGDIWELAGYPYLFSTHANLTHGACMFIGGNTARNDARGPTMPQYCRLVIVRGTSQADISGDDGGLKLEGQAPGGWGTGVNTIYLNTISNGAINTGTGLLTAGGDLNVVGAYKTNGNALFPLSVANGGSGSSTQPIAMASKGTAAQVLTAGGVDVVQFDTEVIDTGNYFDPSTYKFTPQVAGYYQISCGILASGLQQDKLLRAALYKNNTEYAVLVSVQRSGATSTDCGGNGSCLVYFNGSTDYVTVKTYNSNATTGPSLYASTAYTYFHANYVRS